MAVGAGLRFFADSFEEAEQIAQALVEQFHAQGHRWVAVFLMVGVLGPLQSARGATDRARRTFETVIDLTEGRCPPDECEARARLAILEAGDGHADQAAENISRCEEILAQGNGWHGYVGLVAMAKASAAVATGRLSDAEGLFTEALETFRRYEVPFEEAEVLHLWGRALAATDPERAPEKFDAALEIYTSRNVGKAWIDRVLSDRARVT